MASADVAEAINLEDLMLSQHSPFGLTVRGVQLSGLD